MVFDIALSFFRESAVLFNEMAIYLLFGFSVAGLCRAFFKDELISKHLGKRSFKSYFLASLFGVPLPLCSCGVVPTGISLYKQGASKGSVISFLSSTPQTGVDSIFVTYSFLGLPFALFKVIAAFVIGVSGGVFFDALDRGNRGESAGREASEGGASDAGRIKNVRDYFLYSFFELVITLRKWLVIGILLAAAISVLLPKDVPSLIGISHYKISGYLLMLAISVPMYICATASVPIAAALLLKGFSPGAAFVFLIGGPATNAATITVLWKTLGRKATIVYLVNIILGSLFFGYVFDAVFPTYPELHFGAHDHVSGISYLKVTGSVVLFFLIVWTYVADIYLKRKRGSEESYSISFQIEGISCQGCVRKILTSLKGLTFVRDVELSTAGVCTIYLSEKDSDDIVVRKIEELGYKAKKTGNCKKN